MLTRDSKRSIRTNSVNNSHNEDGLAYTIGHCLARQTTLIPFVIPASREFGVRITPKEGSVFGKYCDRNFLCYAKLILISKHLLGLVLNLFYPPTRYYKCHQNVRAENQSMCMNGLVGFTGLWFLWLQAIIRRLIHPGSLYPILLRLKPLHFLLHLKSHSVSGP